MKLDILGFAAHPDDIELSCSGTIAKEIFNGKKVGFIDLTQGELGSRGSAAIRAIEANASSEVLKLSIRDNLKMDDGFFEENKETLLAIVTQIRKYQPEIVLANAVSDRHPDHGRGSALVSRACFLAGLVKIETEQKPWRPKQVYHYIQDRYMKPDFVVDVSEFMTVKMESIKAFKSQFFDPNSEEANTPISGKEFLDFIEARARQFGREIGVEFGEGFTVERPVGTNLLSEFI
jgi:bacillithiol biosynthesis deacetylase BshB1